MRKAINKIPIFLTFFLSFVVLVISIRGLGGSPNEMEINTRTWKEDGPFELSPERGRYALTYSIVENKSLYFSIPLARFSLPDLAYTSGNYVSRFAPTVSVIVIPGYLIGSVFGNAQFGTFLIVSLLAFLNSFLIYTLAIELKANKAAAMLSSLVFLFGTPAYSYAVSLYQHHLTVFVILLSLYFLIKWPGIKSLVAVWFLCALSISIDYPNLVLMFPIGIYTLSRILDFNKTKNNFVLSFSWKRIATILVAVVPIGYFLLFNLYSYGDPFQLSGTVGGVKAIDNNGKPTLPEFADVTQAESYLDPDKQDKQTITFFESREILNGLYIHILSQDRGVLFFAPIVFVGIFGIFSLYKENNKYFAVLIGIALSNLILYSMWGDPWGGWAFGSRYLIPLYSVMALFIAVSLTRYSRNKLFILMFSLFFVYSVLVNTLGALTTSANPPKIQAIPLEQVTGKQERYSWDRNWEYLNDSGSKSFAYNNFFSKQITAIEFYFIIVGLIFLMSFGTLAVLYTGQRNRKL